MHLPPPAQIRIGKSRSQLLFLLFWAAVFAILLVSGRDAFALPTLNLLALAFWGLWAHAAWRWWTSPATQLAWTGREWVWQQRQGKQKCSVRLRLDLQSTALLELQTPDRRRRWLWTERGVSGTSAWLAFRRALVGAHHPMNVDDGGEADFVAPDYLSSGRSPHL